MNKLQYLKKALLFSLLMVVGYAASAQFKGPKVPEKTYTVKEVLDNATRLDRSDAMVRIQGYIIKQINYDTYEFRDSTGTIQVEIDKKRLPNKPFDQTTKLIIMGEVDYDLLRPVEIEVKEVLFAETEK